MTPTRRLPCSSGTTVTTVGVDSPSAEADRQIVGRHVGEGDDFLLARRLADQAFTETEAIPHDCCAA